jgi:hypothetical protein
MRAHGPRLPSGPLASFICGERYGDVRRIRHVLFRIHVRFRVEAAYSRKAPVEFEVKASTKIEWRRGGGRVGMGGPGVGGIRRNGCVNNELITVSGKRASLFRF